MRWLCLACGIGAIAGSAIAQGRTDGETAVIPVLPTLSPLVDGGVEATDIRITFEEDTGGSLRWSDQIARFGAKYLRLHVRGDGAPFPEGASFVVIPEDGRRFDIDLASLPEEGVWTPMVIGARARLAVLSERMPEGAVLLIDRIAKEASGITLYSAHGPNDIRPVHDLEAPEAVSRVAPSVALLSFIKNFESVSCTGFLVGPDILLTNEHCVSSDDDCSSLTAVFGYEADAGGILGEGPQASCVSYDPDWTDFAADVTAIRIAPPPGDAFPHVDVGEMPVEPPEGGLFVIQHPGAVPKHVSFIDCDFADWPVDGREPGTDFSHTCDTARGSSGAPVFDIEGNLVGIHHFGFQDAPNDFWTENRGVRIAPVLDWMAGAGIE